MKKSLRDFWNLKSEFISILILAFLGMFLFTGLINASNGMKNTFDDWADESNLSDIWINYIDLSKDQYNNIKKINGVNDVQKQKVLDLNIGEDKNGGQIKVIVPEKNVISMPNVVNGKNFDTQKQGIWLDEEFANANNYAVGDKVKIWLENAPIEVNIEGLILSSNYVAYTGTDNNLIANHNLYGYAYTTEQSLNTENTQSTNELLIQKRKNKDVSELEEEIEDELSSNFIVATNRTNNPYISSYTQKNDTLMKLSIISSVVFFFLTFLTILTTMQRLVKNQQSIIGIFRALGFKNRTVFFHYSMYGFVVSTIGVFLGVLLGPKLLTPVVLDLQKEQFMMISWQGKSSINEIIVAILLVFASSLVAMLAVRGISKKLPANILRVQLIGNAKGSFLELFSNFWNRLSFDWKWVLRDISRNHKKTLIAVIGVSGSIILLLTSFLMHNSLEKNNTDMYENQYKYQYKVTFEPFAMPEDKEELFIDIQKDGQFITELSSSIKTANKSDLKLLSVIDQGLYTELRNKDGDTIQLENEELVLSHLLADELEINKGESIQVRPVGYDDYITSTVTEIAYVSSPQGAYISSEAWKNKGNEIAPTSLLIGKNINKDKIENYDYVKNIVSIDQQREEGSTVLDSVQSILIVIALIAILLSWTVLYNLGTLNFTERFREYATMKVLGFRPKEIRAIILKDNLLNYLIGVVLGIPIGLVFLQYYAAQLSTSSSEILVSINIIGIVIPALILLICTIVISLIISSRIQKIDMIQSLKSVE